MCSESQNALDEFDKINAGNREPCIISVRTAMNDHNENCKKINSENIDTIIASYLIEQWDVVRREYRRALGSTVELEIDEPTRRDIEPISISENKRGYLGGPEWGGLAEDRSIITGGGFAICSQPVKKDRHGKCDWTSNGPCDDWNNFLSDHTSHWNCRTSMGTSCIGSTANHAAGYTNLGTEMCYLQGGRHGSSDPSPIGHSGKWVNFVREKCGKDGCSPITIPGAGNAKSCTDAGYGSAYWGSQLFECGYNPTGVKRRLREFSRTNLGRGKYLDKILENANQIAGSEPNIITPDDILDYYISKINTAFPDANLDKTNIRDNAGPKSDSNGMPIEGVKDPDNDVVWDADPNKIDAIKRDKDRARGSDKLILPDCCSNTIELGEGSQAMLSDVNQSCSFSAEDNSVAPIETHIENKSSSNDDDKKKLKMNEKSEFWDITGFFNDKKEEDEKKDEKEDTSIPLWYYIALIVALIIFFILI